MSHKCTHPQCATDIQCALGHHDRADCEHWVPETSELAAEASPPEAERISDIPWNGFTLGTNDIAILCGRGRPLLIGLVGPSGAGKTSLLAFAYMWLLRNGGIDGWIFAGSWTLGGWESIVQHSRWIADLPPTFPAHTSSTGRHPGLLHLALRDPRTGTLRDLLLADAPGEWFTHWSRAPNHPLSAGARWLVERSDALLVLTDSDALAHPESMPQARRATRDLYERVGATATACPTIAVWAKSDVEVPALVRASVDKTRSDFLPNAKLHSTRTDRPESIVRLFVAAIEAAESLSSPTAIAEPFESRDPFLAYRGIHVDP